MLYMEYLIISCKYVIQNGDDWWLRLIFFYIWYAIVAEFVQIVICQALFACGLIAPHALRVVEPWQQNVVVVWVVLGKQGYRYYS